MRPEDTCGCSGVMHFIVHSTWPVSLGLTKYYCGSHTTSLTAWIQHLGFFHLRCNIDQVCNLLQVPLWYYYNRGKATAQCCLSLSHQHSAQGNVFHLRKAVHRGGSGSAPCTWLAAQHERSCNKQKAENHARRTVPVNSARGPHTANSSYAADAKKHTTQTNFLKTAF